jgi:hypothetical protein
MKYQAGISLAHTITDIFVVLLRKIFGPKRDEVIGE